MLAVTEDRLIPTGLAEVTTENGGAWDFRTPRVIGDTLVVVASLRPAVTSPPSVLPSAVQREIQQVVTSLWGALPIVPNMETGATDGLFLRNAGLPVYGVSGLFADPTIDADNRAHGLNERIGVRAFYDQLEFTFRLLRGL